VDTEGKSQQGCYDDLSKDTLTNLLPFRSGILSPSNSLRSLQSLHHVSASACPLCVASASSPLSSSPFSLLSSLSSHLPANLKLLEREGVYPRDTATISLQVSMWWPRTVVSSRRQPRNPRSSGSTCSAFDITFLSPYRGPKQVCLSDAPSECIHTLCNRVSPSRDVGEPGIARMGSAECLESPARHRLPASSPTSFLTSCPELGPHFLYFICITSGAISPLPHRDAQCDRPRNGRGSVLVPLRASQTLHGRATASHASASYRKGNTPSLHADDHSTQEATARFPGWRCFRRTRERQLL
jgi:hypothetical protein